MRDSRLFLATATALALGAFAACDDDTTQPGATPEAVGETLAQVVPEGATAMFDALSYFNDPDGGILIFTVRSLDTDVATATVDQHLVTIHGIAFGTTTLIVTAMDPDGLDTSLDFEVIVVPTS